MRVDTAQSLRMWSVESPGAGLGAGATSSSGKQNVSGYRRITGFFAQDQAGVLALEFRSTPTGSVVYTINLPQDVGQPNFTYPFDELVRAPYVTLTFTNGGTPSTFFSALSEALPQ